MITHAIALPRTEVAEPEKIDHSTIFLLGLGIIVIASIIAVFQPGLRSQIQHTFRAESRSVVSTLSGDVLGNGKNFDVVKVKIGEALFIEIYDDADTSKLVQRIPLNASKDAYFNLNGEAVNLALDDVDGDGHSEILVPWFDDDLIAHLGVYKFDKSAKTFKKLSY